MWTYLVLNNRYEIGDKVSISTPESPMVVLDSKRVGLAHHVYFCKEHNWRWKMGLYWLKEAINNTCQSLLTKTRSYLTT